MKKELKDLLSKIEKENFTGTFIYYPAGSQSPHLESYFKMEYSPGNLILRNKNQVYKVEVVDELLFDENYNITYWKETIGNLEKEFSRVEIKQMKEYGILEGRVLSKDPRYVLRIAKDIKKIADNAYKMRIWKDSVLGKEFQVYAEIYLENGVLKKMKISKFAGKKEFKGHGTEIEFQF